ncbi:hypothetical protein U0035_11330 [Niabella yanshanensis]|uniref:Uncharacterized protein n=1 Tax=Niabella yanshanensis TaxID=577386 RepID=A0ABZ0WDF8_9BACT|nr:hypothetical protein [Niabella yanshanensis]WQD40741.1 hypothetical protein U0035_11330 [Niabella yanshanensis]
MMPIRDNGCYCFTFETIDTVDIFTKTMYKQIIVHSLNHFIDSKGLIVYGWCLMSNKLYFIGQSLENISLKELRDDFVVFTSRKIVEAIQSNPSERNTWLLSHFQQAGMSEGAPVQQSCWGDINTTAQIDMKQPQSMAEQLEFIHGLPVKERVVQYSSDYIYSSSRDYIGMPGLVKITRPASVESELYEIESRKNGFRTNYNQQ